MKLRIYVVKLKTFIVIFFILLMLLYVYYVCHSVFFAETCGTFI